MSRMTVGKLRKLLKGIDPDALVEIEVPIKGSNFGKLYRPFVVIRPCPEFPRHVLICTKKVRPNDRWRAEWDESSCVCGHPIKGGSHSRECPSQDRT